MALSSLTNIPFALARLKTCDNLSNVRLFCPQERAGEAAEADGAEEDPAARHPGYFTSTGKIPSLRKFVGVAVGIAFERFDESRRSIRSRVLSAE